MSVIYHEELSEHVENKYLAVNIVAKRARALNETAIVTGASKQKLVVAAAQELIEGKLGFQESETKPSGAGVQSIFGNVLETDEWRDTFNPEVYEEEDSAEGEQENLPEGDVEPEEGL